jgi:glutathione synthase/RimK-type ligase-like ATP-grasp enzyme
LVPKTKSFSSLENTIEQLAQEIEEQFDYPLIMRSPTANRGIGMTKVDSRNELFAVISSGLPAKLLVTEFVDSRGADGFFRKVRAAIVKDEIIIVRVDYSAHWNVRSRRTEDRVSFYLGNPHLLDEANRICRDPEAGLGRPAIQALRAVRDRIPLDVFGVDFDVDADGRLVFYEANATMNLFSTARMEVPYPKEADDCLKLAFRRYLTSLVARR